MKKILPCLFGIICGLNAFSQNNVGIGTPTPDPSSVLELSSSNKGFLVPRTHIGNIATPVTGLLIYDLDSNCYVLYNGLRWQNLCLPNVNIPTQTPALNDSVIFNPVTGTLTVVDSNGAHRLSAVINAWLTNGNTGTTAGTNFVGTTDAQDLVIKSNGNEVMRATQNGAVGINTPLPNPTSILDITSTTKGVLFPALTSLQRNAIAAPAVGLTIYNTDLNVHQFWNGTCWVNVGQTVCSFTYGVSQSHSADCLFKSNFNSVSDTLTVSLLSGTPSPVILSAAGVPAGVLVNFSNNYLTPTATSVMTLTALPSAPDGVYTITILASSGSTIQTLTYTLTIYDFAASLSHYSASVSFSSASAGGTIDTATITIGNAGSCTTSGGTALLSSTVTPSAPWLTVTFGNPNLPIPGSTLMTISSTCAAVPGTYSIYVTSTVGVSVSTSIFTLVIGGSSPIHITTSTQNLNLYTFAGSPPCPVADTFIIDAGVTIGSDTSTQSSLTTGAFATGSHIVIINNGSIIGAGGAGGNDFGYGGTVIGGACSQVDGAQGGTALTITTAGVTINNNGTIAGGGGGGGAGGALGITACTVDVRPGTGGGGGAGSAGGPGGTAGGGSYPCNPGNPGTLLAGGTGGAICNQGPCTIIFATFGPYNGGQGGTGGALGQPGSVGNNANALIGGTGVCSPGNGGAAGYSLYIGGNPYTYSGAALIGPTHP